MKFTMTTPCDDCPFRYDVHPFIRPDRVLEIQEYNDGGFPCHKTVNYNDDGEVGLRNGEIHCAGSLILQANEGAFGQLARIAMRMNSDGKGFDPENLDMDAQVYDGWDSMYEAYVNAEGN